MDHLLSIKSFVAVVQFESFTRAAAHLNMSTAALSRAVSNLEAHTQTRLLHRSSRHVALADSARDYYAACADMLERLAECEQRLADERDAHAGTIRIAAHPFAIEAGLPSLLDSLRACTPELRIAMHVENGPLRLELGDYDVAVYPRDLIGDATAICRPLVSSPLVLVCSDAYWTRIGRRPTPDDFSGQVLIVCEGAVARKPELKLKRDGVVCAPLTPAARLVVAESTAIRLALSGYGLALLPRITVERYLPEGRLRIVLPGHDLDEAHAELDVAFMRRQSLPRRTRNFVDACMRHFGGGAGSAAVTAAVN